MAEQKEGPNWPFLIVLGVLIVPLLCAIAYFGICRMLDAPPKANSNMDLFDGDIFPSEKDKSLARIEISYPAAAIPNGYQLHVQVSRDKTFATVDRDLVFNANQTSVAMHVDTELGAGPWYARLMDAHPNGTKPGVAIQLTDRR